MWARVDDRKPFTAALVGLILLAWLVLLAWGQSPYGRFLSHEQLGEVKTGLSGDTALVALAFVGGWALLTFALVRRPARRLLAALLVAGYVVIWAAFVVLAHAGDFGLHQAVQRSHWLGDHAWAIGGATLLLAGVYQFTPLKDPCLDKCRSPFSFISERWGGSRERLASFQLGVQHGLFCVGCCWSLMLLMFAVGTGSLGWMLAPGTAMAIGKKLPRGRRL